MTAERLLRTLDQPRRLIWLAFAAIVTVAWSVLLGADPMASDLWREVCGAAQAAPGYHVALWTAMVFAMMLPSAAPMILLFATVNRKQRARADPFVPTSVQHLPHRVRVPDPAPGRRDRTIVQLRRDLPQRPSARGSNRRDGRHDLARPPAGPLAQRRRGPGPIGVARPVAPEPAQDRPARLSGGERGLGAL